MGKVTSVGPNSVSFVLTQCVETQFTWFIGIYWPQSSTAQVSLHGIREQEALCSFWSFLQVECYFLGTPGARNNQNRKLN